MHQLSKAWRVCVAELTVRKRQIARQDDTYMMNWWDWLFLWMAFSWRLIHFNCCLKFHASPLLQCPIYTIPSSTCIRISIGTYPRQQRSFVDHRTLWAQGTCIPHDINLDSSSVLFRELIHPPLIFNLYRVSVVTEDDIGIPHLVWQVTLHFEVLRKLVLLERNFLMEG